MTSNSNIDVKRTPQKTYSAFNALPTLRGKDQRDAEKSPTRRYKRPPQLADQLLFPGRRLDRPHRSTYSGYSGRSWDIETIVSGGRVNNAELNNSVGLAKPGSLLGNSFSQSLNDVSNQPWDSLRQLPSAHSHMSLISRQGSQNLFSASGRPRTRGLAKTLPGASASTGNLNALSTQDFDSGSHAVPTNKWQKYGNHGQQHNFFQQKIVSDSSSPDSSYSSEFESDPEWPVLPSPVVTAAVPPPAIKLHRQTSDTSNTRKQTNNKKPPRRPSENTNTSSTPQLDKILWALVPDEFANISDTGISDLDPSLQETNSSRYVTVTDLEAADLDTSGGLPTTRVPDTPRHPTLTQETLSHVGTTAPNDDRILHWLADCEAHTLSTSLPTHLPDISYTFKFAHSKS